jgi:hypothetical protein
VFTSAALTAAQPVTIQVLGVTTGLCPASPAAPVSATSAQPVTLTLASGQEVVILLDNELSGALPPGWQLLLRFDPRPLPPYVDAAAAIEGGTMVQTSAPFRLQVLAADCISGDALPLPDTVLDFPVSLLLPVDTAPLAADTQFAWLRGLWDADTFAGYLRIDAPFDGPTGALVFSATIADVESALFLPVLVAPAYVQNVDPDLHIWSGPDKDLGLGPDDDIGAAATNAAVDFGLAATHQFTTFRVVGPQVGARLYVANTETGAYGWVDGTGVGPPGPPA